MFDLTLVFEPLLLALAVLPPALDELFPCSVVGPFFTPLVVPPCPMRPLRESRVFGPPVYHKISSENGHASSWYHVRDTYQIYPELYS